MRRKGLFSYVLTLVVFALIISGCGGSSGGGGGSNGGNNGNNAGGDLSGYIGVWKSVDSEYDVEVTVGNQIEGDEGYRYFTGKVTCDAFRYGGLDITGPDFHDDKYIVVNIFDFNGQIMTSFHVRAREEYDDEFGTTVVNEFELDGTLGDANTLQVHRLRIFSQKNKTEYNFEPEDDRYLTFKK